MPLSPEKIQAHLADLTDLILMRPEKAEIELKDRLGDDVERVLITGGIGGRIAVLIGKEGDQVVLSMNGSSIDTLPNHEKLSPSDAGASVSPISMAPEQVEMISRPTIKLVALYHQENFPRPRFALNIAHLANALRKKMVGKVSLFDMQLGESSDQIVRALERQKPDIVGISATFGQQDLLEEIIGGIGAIDGYDPLIIVGGSLVALNREHILRAFPKVIVAEGHGETTMQDVAELWHDMRSLKDVNNISYVENDEIVTTTKRVKDSIADTIPELDLLDRTLDYRGVMQLEASRGCTHACSFCPRHHKGLWGSDGGNNIAEIMPGIARIFDRHPEIARKIFLLDEEFIGGGDEETNKARIRKICNALTAHGFTFETSARMDQVFNPKKSPQWHAERMDFWKNLRNNGLDRVLFGVESGVDSVLKRFNKKTTGPQNALGIRAVSALNVPFRFTYITFDPLMDMSELIETYRFQGRKDLLMKPTDMDASALYEAIQDDDFAKANATGEPFYRQISYMLVSMECLLGSKYLESAEAAGLNGETCLSMGRKNINYLDPRIGMMSEHSQMWIDRSFALDYMLKSVEKVSERDVRHTIRELRKVLKDAAYELFGMMLASVNGDPAIAGNLNLDEGLQDLLSELMAAWTRSEDPAHRENLFKSLIDSLFTRLVGRFDAAFSPVKGRLPEADLKHIEEVIDTWKNSSEWRLINAA
jgi:radical SAM superfamily enzyme YgiQ (UPF0313 family)